MRSGDGSAGGLPGWSGIEADLVSLRELAVRLRGEVDASLRPRTRQAFPPMVAGAVFAGRSPSVDLHGLREKYADSLADHRSRRRTRHRRRDRPDHHSQPALAGRAAMTS
jgi:hypothetical protein